MKLKTWDGNNINDGTNYDAILNANFYGLPGIRAILGMRHGSWPILAGVERPGRELNFEIYIRSGSSLELEQWFDPEDETAKQLIAEDNAGGNDRFVYAICTELREVPLSAGLQYAVTLQIDGDVRWRETSLTAPSVWNVTASGQTQAFVNNGQDDAYPTIKISPQEAKADSWPYKRFIPVKWRGTSTATNYPVDIVNNSLDTQIGSTNFSLADGDDLRVWVDGIEVDRWLSGINTASTIVWANFDWEVDIPMTLDGEINNSVTAIRVNQSINNMPSSGIIYIETEAITYTSKSNATKTFNGCTRGAKGTSADSHSDATATFWLQHDIWILYGNAAAGAPTIDDDYKPMFSLANSTNTSWDYDDFREHDDLYPTMWKPRAGAWQQSGNVEDFYTATQHTFADPAEEIGLYSDSITEQGWMYLKNACGITSANFQNGEHKSTVKIDFDASIKSSTLVGIPTITEYTIPDPASDNSWDTWSRDETLEANSKSVGLHLLNTEFDEMWVEAADVILTLNSSYTPVIVIGAEQGNYSLACTITNNTTGKSITVTYSMALTDEIEVDTDEKTVIDLEDSTNQFQAVEVVGDPRHDWLSLQVGSNTLQFDDTGTSDVDITLTWEERYYQ